MRLIIFSSGCELGIRDGSWGGGDIMWSYILIKQYAVERKLEMVRKNEVDHCNSKKKAQGC